MNGTHINLSFGLFITFLSMPIFILSSGINFKDQTSTLEFTNNSHFILDKKISNCQGKISKQNDATIDGEEIEFDDGYYQESDKVLKIKGTLETGASNKIKLTGSQTLHGSIRTTFQDIEISGTSNRLEGKLKTNNDIVLLDENTSVTCSLARQFPQNFILNGGILFLEENLGFIDTKKIVGTGTVICNCYKLVFGTSELDWDTPICFDHGNDIELNSQLNLSQTWTFSGAASPIMGNGNIL